MSAQLIQRHGSTRPATAGNSPRARALTTRRGTAPTAGTSRSGPAPARKASRAVRGSFAIKICIGDSRSTRRRRSSPDVYKQKRRRRSR